MIRKSVLIVGTFLMPDGDAAAIRVRGIGKALNIAGYEVFYLGRNVSDNKEILSYENAIYFTRKQWGHFSYYYQFKYISDVIETNIGKENLSTVILYHQPAISALLIGNYCKKHNITLITDTTEWYGIDQLLKNRFFALPILDFEFRMHFSNVYLKNTIVISSFLKNYYLKKKCNVVQIPILNLSDNYDTPSRDWHELRLCYCGSPAKKDLIVPFVSALKKCLDSGLNICADIVGIDKEQYITQYGNSDLPKNIRFHGRVSHETAIDILKNSDFSLIIRRNKRYAKAGFPTKMVEAFSNGVGVIATPNGDVSKYVTDGVNGYIVSFEHTEEELTLLFTRLATFDDSQLLNIKINAQETAKSFECKKYSEVLAKYIHTIEKERNL